MLEVKWKALLIATAFGGTGGFNPCYVGSKMERKVKVLLSKYIRRFNPCYVGSKMESVVWLRCMAHLQ